MNILLVSDSYPPLIGGATRATQQLAQELTRRGHTVTVATAWQADLPQEDWDGLVRVYRLRDLTSRVGFLSADPTRHTPPPFPDPEAVWRFRRLLRRLQPEVVHAYGWLSYSCALALLGMGIPMVLGARDYGNVCALRTLYRSTETGRELCSGPAWGKCLSCAGRFYGQPKGLLAVTGVLGGRALLRHAVRGLHSCSGYVQTVMHRFLLPERQLQADMVLPDFRDDMPPAAPDPSLLTTLPDGPYILFVGALRLIKGIEPLLSAYSQLKNAPPLVLIGTPAPDTPPFPPQVTVLRSLPHAAVMAAWQGALFGVAPSVLPEPLGNVVHEAMSQGKAMIGTFPGGHGEMITDGKNGLLVPAGDAAALARAMQRLIDDPLLRAALGERSRKDAGRFTASSIVPQLEALLAEVGRRPLGQRP